ncbi:hypothetical protein Bbelb_050630 [Branchiostoma belcheri]|nr:hypothetical protein Bbelb_050630 [Branchiostoma belcheri]
MTPGTVYREHSHIRGVSGQRDWSSLAHWYKADHNERPQPAALTAHQGFPDDEEGIRADEEGIRADVEGIRTDVEGTSIRADVEGIRTDVEGIRADTHACTYGPPYISIKHPLRSIIPRHIVRAVCTERMFPRFSADNELRHDVTRPNLCRARPTCRTFPAIPIFGKLGRMSERMDIIWILRSPADCSVSAGWPFRLPKPGQLRENCDKTDVFTWNMGLVIPEVFIRINMYRVPLSIDIDELLVQGDDFPNVPAGCIVCAFISY